MIFPNAPNAEIPAEVGVHIFSFLSEADLKIAALVCKSWDSIACSNTFQPYAHIRHWKIFRWIGPHPDQTIATKICDWHTHARKARKFAQNYWSEREESPDNWGTLATRLYKAGYLNEALATYSHPHILSNRAAHESSLCNVATIFYKLKRFDEAFKLVKPLENNKKALRILGDIYRCVGKYDKSREAYISSFFDNKPQKNWNSYMGLFQLCKDNHEEGLLDSLTNKYTKHATTTIQKAELQYHIGTSPKQTINLLNIAIKDGSRLDLAYKLLGEVTTPPPYNPFRYLGSERPEMKFLLECSKAIEYFEKSIAENLFQVEVFEKIAEITLNMVEVLDFIHPTNARLFLQHTQASLKISFRLNPSNPKTIALALNVRDQLKERVST